MKKVVNIAIGVFFLFSIIGLGVAYYFLLERIAKIENDYQNLSRQKLSEISEAASLEEGAEIEREAVGTCGKVCMDAIESRVGELASSLPKVTQTVAQTVPASQISKTYYIPLGSVTTTTSVDWIDVADSGVYVDLVNDYGANAKVSWEAYLKVAHGNGKVFARLWDDTNKIAVDHSELTTENNADFKQATTSNLPFWRGRNLYKVQMKSLNSFEVTYSGGKLKVVY